MRIGGGTYHRQAQEAQALLLLQGTCCSKSGGPLPKADHLPDLLSPLACGVSTAWQWSRQSSRSPLSGGGVGAEAPPFSSFQFTLLQGTLLLASCQQPCYSCFLVNKVKCLLIPFCPVPGMLKHLRLQNWGPASPHRPVPHTQMEESVDPQLALALHYGHISRKPGAHPL
jgi:hypothetical protein